MSLLRVFASSADTAGRCQWVLLHKDRDPIKGEGRLEDLPQGADKVHLVFPAQQILITRTKLLAEARRRAGSVLAFAIEEQMIGEPDANEVILGRDVLNHLTLLLDGPESTLIVPDEKNVARLRRD